MRAPSHTTLDSIPLCVALDLETTGTSPEQDEIIEVGAVKFRGEQVLESFTTLVDPYCPLPPFVQRLTGITQAELEKAPPFAVVAGDLLAFLGDAPVVGHNVSFDLAFLSRRGVRLAAPSYDTYELASVLLPRGEYSLGALARSLGIAHPRAHRALADAQVTQQVFVALVQRAAGLDPALLEEWRRLATLAGNPLRYLLGVLLAGKEGRAGGPSRLGLGGLDLAALAGRLASSGEAARASSGPLPKPDDVVALLKPGGALAQTLPGYEFRPQQEEMLRAVYRAFSDGGSLVVEAGTGVGKSLAYLAPAALFALKKGVRVVVSTNTIGLQEQIVRKDLPTVTQALERHLGAGARTLRWATLKGRGNYLCLQRFAHLRSDSGLTLDESRVLAKLLVWLQETAAGDRSELTLPPRDTPVWDRLSAEGAAECPRSRGPCFLASARSQAESAHILVVNHALLLSDLAVGGSLLPSYDYLIVDEAHHLEDEATRQFGFQVRQYAVADHLEALAGPRGLAGQAVAAYAAAAVALSRRQVTEGAAAQARERVARARQRFDEMVGHIGVFLRQHASGADERGAQLWVTESVRAQPGWSRLEVLWENVDLALAEVLRATDDLQTSLEGLEQARLPDYEALRAELSAHSKASGELRRQLREFLVSPERSGVYWVVQDAHDALSLCAAPLEVGGKLKKLLFDQKKTVVLTSATLSTEGSCQPLARRLGLEESEELVLGSPFDYRRAALVCLPRDMPEPDRPTYHEALAVAISTVAEAAKGRTLALFTSHSALRAAASALRGPLESRGLRLLAQGVEGSPRGLLEEFQRNSAGVLLGTASFWEGVDLPSDALRVLLIARLPFNVPTEPVFAARGQLYEDPFNQYAVPLAVLRLRQGFGRLVRHSESRGVVVLLDRRLLTRPYGKVFLNSLPPCTVAQPTLREIGQAIKTWLSG